MTTRVKITNEGPNKVKAYGTDQAVRFLDAGDSVEFDLFPGNNCRLLEVVAEPEPSGATGPTDHEATQPADLTVNPDGSVKADAPQ